MYAETQLYVEFGSTALAMGLFSVEVLLDVEIGYDVRKGERLCREVSGYRYTMCLCFLPSTVKKAHHSLDPMFVVGL